MNTARVSGLRRAGFLALLTALLLLAGCRQDLYGKLTESDANEMLSALLDAHLDAEKASPDGKSWNVSVDKTEIAQGLTVLRIRGLPAPRHASLGEMFKKEGLISTPTEERVRFIFGTQQALESTLENIDGVVVAKVNLVLPNNDPLADHVKPSSASVFIKHLPTAAVTNLSPLVKNLVIRSVEGLTYDNVNVMMVEVASPRRAATAPGPRAPETTAASLLPVLIGLVTLAVLGGVLWVIARFKPGLLPAGLRKRIAPLTNGA